MENKDGSDWFTSSPKPLENAVELARNFLEPAIMQAIHEACCDILNERPTVDSMKEAVAAAISIAEEIWSDLQSESPPYACKKGCSWFRHQMVMVIAPEVLSARINSRALRPLTRMLRRERISSHFLSCRRHCSTAARLG